VQEADCTFLLRRLRLRRSRLAILVAPVVARRDMGLAARVQGVGVLVVGRRLDLERIGALVACRDLGVVRREGVGVGAVDTRCLLAELAVDAPDLRLLGVDVGLGLQRGFGVSLQALLLRQAIAQLFRCQHGPGAGRRRRGGGVGATRRAGEHGAGTGQGERSKKRGGSEARQGHGVSMFRKAADHATTGERIVTNSSAAVG
jgi:hypothetical protein